MALSSDELIKQEVSDEIGEPASSRLRIFPQSSRADQDPFSEGGLTFGVDGVLYGSCDAAWYIEGTWCDPYSGLSYSKRPIVALEGTDALNRNSGGNAQYQRFHHALGAVRAGIVGVYYLRPGSHAVQPDLLGMAVKASQTEPGTYLITSSLGLVKEVVAAYGTERLYSLTQSHLKSMQAGFDQAFNERYGGSWDQFAARRSSVIFPNYVVKYAGRNKRNFLEGSQRAGHIAVGEMYLSKYLFYPKPVVYLFPRMVSKDIEDLDASKRTDKEWHLLRSEPGVSVATLDDLAGVTRQMRTDFADLRDVPLKGAAMTKFRRLGRTLHSDLQENRVTVQSDLVIQNLDGRRIGIELDPAE